MKKNCFVLLATVVAVWSIGEFGGAQGLSYGTGNLTPISNSSGLAPVISPAAMTTAGLYPPPGQIIPASYAQGGGCACGAGCTAGHGCCAAGGGCDCGQAGCRRGCANWCCEGGFTNCWSVYGEYLFLRARDVEVAWGEPIDGPIVPPGPAFPIQIGKVATADLDFQPGFRFGFAYNPDCCTSISAEYTMWEGATTDTLGTAVPNVLHSLVSHPGTATAAQNFLAGQANYGISVDMVDVAMHSLLTYCPDFQFGYVAGVRWAQTEQIFQADFAGNATESVFTDIDFYGFGVRGGFEGEKWIGRQLSVHAKGLASLIPGEFRANYRQVQSYDPNVVTANWTAGRIVPILDLELGTSWTSRCDTWKLTASYMFSAWFNSVQTDEWIQAVRTNNFVGLSDTMTFDGLMARLEARY